MDALTAAQSLANYGTNEITALYKVLTDYHTANGVAHPNELEYNAIINFLNGGVDAANATIFSIMNSGGNTGPQ